MKWFVPLLALAGLASHAFGCLGDSEEDLDKRYGKQVKTGTSHLPGVTIRGYFANGFLVVVGVLNGKSAYEMYSKKDHKKITPQEVGALMNANASGKTWSVDNRAPAGTARWVLEDGAVVAEWEKESGAQLTVMTKEAADLEKADTPKKKEPEKPKRP